MLNPAQLFAEAVHALLVEQRTRCAQFIEQASLADGRPVHAMRCRSAPLVSTDHPAMVALFKVFDPVEARQRIHGEVELEGAPLAVEQVQRFLQNNIWGTDMEARTKAFTVELRANEVNNKW